MIEKKKKQEAHFDQAKTLVSSLGAGIITTVKDKYIQPVKMGSLKKQNINTLLKKKRQLPNSIPRVRLL